MVINIAITPFLIHGLGLDQFGLYALAATITIFLSSFDGGIGQTALRYFSLYAGKGDRATATRLLSALVLVVLVGGGVLSLGDWLVAPTLGHLFHMPDRYRSGAVFLLRTFGVLISVSLMHSLFVSVLLGHQRYALNAKATIISYLAWAGGLYVTVTQHYGLRGVALSLIAEQVFATVIVLPNALGYLDRHSVRPVGWAELREFLAYAWQIQVQGIASLVNMQFDALVIGAVLPVRNVGLYNAGSNPATQLLLVMWSGVAPAATRLSNLFGESGQAAARQEAVRLQRLWVIVTSGVDAAVIGAGYFAVVAWLGHGFATAGIVMVVLFVGYAFSLFTSVMLTYAAAIGRPDLSSRSGVIGMAVNLVLTVPFAFTGVIGIVAATAAGQVIGSFYSLRLIRRRLDTEFPPFSASIPVLRTLGCLAVTVGIEAGIAPLVPQGPAGLIICGLPPMVAMALYALSFLDVRRAILAQRGNGVSFVAGLRHQLGGDPSGGAAPAATTDGETRPGPPPEGALVDRPTHPVQG